MGRDRSLPGVDDSLRPIPAKEHLKGVKVMGCGTCGPKKKKKKKKK